MKTFSVCIGCLAILCNIIAGAIGVKYNSPSPTEERKDELISYVQNANEDYQGQPSKALIFSSREDDENLENKEDNDNFIKDIISTTIGSMAVMIIFFFISVKNYKEMNKD